MSGRGGRADGYSLGSRCKSSNGSAGRSSHTRYRVVAQRCDLFEGGIDQVPGDDLGRHLTNAPVFIC